MTQKITFKKNRKKMPYVLHLTLFLFILGAICSLLLSVVNFYTKSVIENNEYNKLKQTLEEVGLYNFKTVSNDYEKVEGIIDIYEGNNKDGKDSVAFVVEKANRYLTIKSLIVLSKEGRVENIKILSNATTHNMNDQFNQNFGIIGSDKDNFSNNFQIVTGATTSSNTVKESVEIAFKQLSIMKNEEFIDIKQILSELGVNNYQDISNYYDKIDGVLEVYKGQNNEGKTNYVFVTASSNPYMTIKTIIVIDKHNEAIDNLKVISRAASYPLEEGWEEKFNQNFGVIGSDIDNYEHNFQIVSGATTSSNNVKECIKLAFDQFNLIKNSINETLNQVEITNAEDILDYYDQTKGVYEVYSGKNKDSKDVYAFFTSSSNAYMTIRAVIVISKETGFIENIKVISRAASYPLDQGWEEKFNQDFGVIGSNKDNYDDNFQIITGATTSSENVKECIKFAFEQFELMNNLENTLKNLGVFNYQIITNDYEKIFGVKNIYFGQNENGSELYAFETESSNDYMTIKTIIVISKETSFIENIKVISRAASYPLDQGWEEKFNQDFGIIGSNKDNYNDNFIVVTGATTSSNNVLECITIAYDQLTKMKGNA